MVLVSSGVFWMGCEVQKGRECADNDAIPLHKVYVDAFYIDKHEVTITQYNECVKDGKCEAPHFNDGTCECCALPTGASFNIFMNPDQPVVCVNWYQAKSYCEWKGKRLPTEAEWEKAARGTDGRKYPWGNQMATCDFAVMDDTKGKGGDGCGKNRTWSVGSKPKGASPYGAMDMAGNVAEWTQDWYDFEYYKNSPLKNPKGPRKGKYKVVRGGSWHQIWVPLVVYERSGNKYDPHESRCSYGFRCSMGADLY